MKIALIGGGACGIYSALLLHKKYPNDEIIIFEQGATIGKKFTVAGNGRCNINNIIDDATKYNQPCFVRPLLDDFPLQKQNQLLKELGIYLTELHEGYLYPISLSGKNVLKILQQQISNCPNLLVKTGMKLIDYEHKSNNEIVLFFENGEKIKVNRLIIVTGGCSSPKLGSNGNLFALLNKKGYKINGLLPGLTALKTKEKVKPLFGEKIRAKIALLSNNQIIHQENGEIVFKDDGLGGIAIMNLSSIIQRNKLSNPAVKIQCLGDDIGENDLLKINKTIDNVLWPFVGQNTAQYIYQKANVKIDNKLSRKDAQKLLWEANNLSFTIVSTYGFNDSQVTIGGLDINEIDNFFQSKKEQGIYFGGEVLDIDGLCGGYNLKWALVNAHYLVENFK